MHTTHGIILKKTDAGETDALYTIYTKDFGKIRALAKGIKKEDAKLKGHLEAVSLSMISFVEGKSGFRLTHASLMEPWRGIRNDLRKLDLAVRIAGLIDAECFEMERDDGLWKLCTDTFQEIERTETTESINKFTAQLKEALGYGRENV